MPNPKLQTYKNKATNTVYDLTDAEAQSKLTAILDGTNIDSFGDVETAVSALQPKNLSHSIAGESTVENALDAIAAGSGVTVDDAMSSSSTNPVQNKVITSALAGKQDTLTFDNFPTAGSSNPVKSGGVKSATSEIWGVIGTIEAGLTSTHAYEVGDHIICWIGFAEVIAPIAVGDELQRNVNVVEGDVAEAVSDNLRGVIANTKLIKDTVGWSGKNKLPRPYKDGTSKVDGSLTWTVLEDGTVKANGSTGASQSVFWLSDNMTFDEALKLTGCPSGASSSTYCFGGTYVGAEVTKDIPANTQFSVACVVKANQSVSNIIFKPLLCDPNILDLSYEPYHDSVEKGLNATTLAYTPNAGISVDGGYSHVLHAFNDVKVFLDFTVGNADISASDAVITLTGGKPKNARHTGVTIRNVTDSTYDIKMAIIETDGKIRVGGQTFVASKRYQICCDFFL